MIRVKVLVVDDEPAIRKLLQRGLTGYGYHVDVATNGQEALTTAAQGSPDIILLDVKSWCRAAWTGGLPKTPRMEHDADHHAYGAR